MPIPARAPLPPELATQAPFIARGVSGHAGGKACTRTGLDAILQPHAPRIDGARPAASPALDAVVLHFDGLTPLHWLVKLRRYAAHDPTQWERFLAPHRRAQLEFVRDHDSDPAALRAFHDRLKKVHDLAALKAAGLIRSIAFDAAAPMRRWLGQTPDLGVAGFDKALRDSFPSLTARL